MTVCNVGDSRVLLGHRVLSTSQQQCYGESKEEVKVDVDEELSQEASEGTSTSLESEILVIPLTRDQTPYRRDERERVEYFGAEIRSVDGKTKADWGDSVLGDFVDIEGDPPRIWLYNKQYPGTAFTRSSGDKMAERLVSLQIPR